MSMNRSTILGLFFLVTLSVLAYYTLFLTDFTLFKKQAQLRVQFAEANGLREGDAVLVAGMRWGRVKKMTFDPTAPVDKRVTVLAVLNDPLPLHEGFKIRIKDATLLGGRNLSIDPGPAEGKHVAADQVLPGEVSANPIDELSKIIDTSGPAVQETIENIRAVSADLRSGKGLIGRLTQDPALADDFASSLTSVSKTASNLEEITSDLHAGKGTAGLLLTNDDLYSGLNALSQKSQTLVDEATGVATDLRHGNGLFGRLLEDPTLANDVASFTASTREIAEKINRGQGTLGVLVNDEGIARDLASTARNLASGQGTIGALLTDPSVFENIRQITEDMAVFSSALRSGQGSVGRLVMDDDLYQDLKTAIRIVQRSLEEFREAAPISTFTTVFFQAF